MVGAVVDVDTGLAAVMGCCCFCSDDINSRLQLQQASKIRPDKSLKKERFISKSEDVAKYTETTGAKKIRTMQHGKRHFFKTP